MAGLGAHFVHVGSPTNFAYSKEMQMPSDPEMNQVLAVATSILRRPGVENVSFEDAHRVHVEYGDGRVAAVQVGRPVDEG